MSRMKHGLLVVLLAALACEVPQAPIVAPATLITRDAWPGGEVRIRLAGPLATGGQAIIGGDTNVLAPTHDSILSVFAPRARGTYAVKLRSFEGDLLLDDEVQVHGLVDIRLGPRLAGYPLPLSHEQPVPIVMVNGESSLVRVDLRTGSVTAFPRSMHDPNCVRGPGPTPFEGVYVLARPLGANPFACTFALWRVAPTASLLRDSVPGGARLVAQLSDTSWIVSPGQHQVCLSVRVVNYNDCLQFEEINGIRFSPRGDRAFMYNGWSPTNHVPVFDASTGKTAFTVTEAVSSGGGSFSAGSDTLFLAAYADSSNKLLVLNARDGRKLASIPIPFDPEDVLAEPGAPWVYVWGWTWQYVPSPVAHNEFTAHLLFLDRRTMSVVSEMTMRGGTQASADSLCYNCDNRLFLDPMNRELYILGISGREGRAGAQSSIARVSLLPN